LRIKSFTAKILTTVATTRSFHSVQLRSKKRWPAVDDRSVLCTIKILRPNNRISISKQFLPNYATKRCLRFPQQPKFAWMQQIFWGLISIAL